MEYVANRRNNTIVVSGRLSSPQKAVYALVADESDARPGEYWTKTYVGTIAKDGSFDVTVTEPSESSGTLKTWFAFETGAQTGDGKTRGRESGAFRFGDLPLESARELDGAAMERRIAELQIAPPLGYHQLDVECGEHKATMRLIVAPTQCYLPPPLDTGGRVWGIAAQLYGLRSKRNWGIGDFTDLAKFCTIAAKLGASTIGLNPLHALFPGRPERFSRGRWSI